MTGYRVRVGSGVLVPGLVRRLVVSRGYCHPCLVLRPDVQSLGQGQTGGDWVHVGPVGVVITDDPRSEVLFSTL